MYQQYLVRPVQRRPGLARVLRRLPAGQPGGRGRPRERPGRGQRPPPAPAAAAAHRRPRSPPRRAAPKPAAAAAEGARRRGAAEPAPERSRPAAKPADKPAAAKPATPVAAGKQSPLRGAAASVVKNMNVSLTVPTATSVRAVPAKLLADNRIVINNHLARSRGGKVSFTHLIGYALVRALDDFPNMNSAFAEVDGKPVLVAARARQLRPGHRPAEVRRLALARGGLDQGRRGDGLRQVLGRLRGHHPARAAGQAHASRTSPAPRSA